MTNDLGGFFDNKIRIAKFNCPQFNQTNMSKSDDHLLLQNQLCFPLYAASRMMIQAYREPLEELSLTYPQYLVMLVLWEKDGLTVSQIGEKLFLDSGTLTPVLKRLEANNFIKRNRSEKDERKVKIELTYPGKSLKARAAHIPEKIESFLNQWEQGELIMFKTKMNKLIDTLKH